MSGESYRELNICNKYCGNFTGNKDIKSFEKTSIILLATSPGQGRATSAHLNILAEIGDIQVRT